MARSGWEAALTISALTSFPGLNALCSARFIAVRSASAWSIAFTVMSSSTLAIRRALTVNSRGCGLEITGLGCLLGEERSPGAMWTGDLAASFPSGAFGCAA